MLRPLLVEKLTELSFDTAVRTAMEQASKDIESLQRGMTALPPNPDVGHTTVCCVSTGTARKCYRCARNHQVHKGPFKGAICHVCKVGHIQQACWTVAKMDKKETMGDDKQRMGKKNYNAREAAEEYDVTYIPEQCCSAQWPLCMLFLYWSNNW